MKKQSNKSKRSTPRPIRHPGLAYSIECQPIGWIETVYKEKFGIPRQNGLAQGASGVIRLRNEPFLRQALKALETFSHLWVIFVFHAHDAKAWKPTIRPPRLGGAKKVGVLASRSPHRPNPIGLSAVKIERILVSESEAPDGPEIHVSGVDILDGTPVIDIKPYVPYADSIPDASGGWASEPIPRQSIEWTDVALKQLSEHSQRHEGLRAVIEDTLALDPRPASQRRRYPAGASESLGLKFGFDLLDLDVQWEIGEQGFRVIALVDRRGGEPRKPVFTKDKR